MANKRKTRKQADNGQKVPTHDTPPTASITPPSTHRHDVLPLVDVGSVAFEKLCRDIVHYDFREIQSRALKRELGQSQFGADVEGFDADHRSPVVVSSKCYHEVKARYLLPWTKHFSGHLDGHWKDKGVKHFVLAITQCRNDDHLNEAARACAEELKPHGITFDLWDALHITDLLRRDPSLVERYFNKYWVDAISATAGNYRRGRCKQATGAGRCLG